MDDPFLILGLRYGATKEEIKTAYRQAVKLHHPDLNQNKDDTEFKKVQAAYEKIQSGFRPKPKDYTKHTSYERSTYIFYRILSSDNSYHKIDIPIDKIVDDTEIRCLYGSQEFRIVLPIGTELPINIKIKNIKPVLHIYIYHKD